MGVTLTEAYQINNAGIIGAFGNPGNRAYLLTPISGQYIKDYDPTSAAAGRALRPHAAGRLRHRPGDH